MPQPRQVEIVGRRSSDKFKNLFLVKVSPPLTTDESVYRPSVAPEHLLLAPRWIGQENLANSPEWPVHVHVLVIIDEIALTKEHVPADAYLHQIWGILYKDWADVVAAYE